MPHMTDTPPISGNTECMADDNGRPQFYFDDVRTPVQLSGELRAFDPVTDPGGWPKPVTDEAKEEIRLKNKLATVRAETSTSSYPVLVNDKAEVDRLEVTLVQYKRPYPLMTVSRKEASVILLFAYLIRVILWRLFFARVVDPNPMQVNPTRIRPPKGGDAAKSG